MSYVVKWGKERLYFPLPSPDTNLAVIRKQLADYTHLPEHSFKLVHAGAVMKDDNTPISVYGIKENSTIAIIGGGDNIPPGPPGKTKPSTTKTNQTPRRPTEESTISQIKTELDKVRKALQPDVNTFLSTLSEVFDELSPATADSSAPTPTEQVTNSSSSPTPSKGKGKGKGKSKSGSSPSAATVAPSSTTKSPFRDTDPALVTLAQEHIRLGELLLQSLLRLDAINAEGEWEHARKERKTAVREVQGLLDTLDGAWRSRPRG